MGGNGMYTVCRLCLSENNTLFDIFEPKGIQGWKAADIIMELLRFQLSSDDKYPHCVCSECMRKLEDFKLFKQRCETSKELLDRAYAVKYGFEPIEEPDVRDFDHDGNQHERYIREEDVEIRIKEEPLDSDVEENSSSSSGVVESTNQIIIPIKKERHDNESTVETEHIPRNSSTVPQKSPDLKGHFVNSEHIIKEEVLDIPAESISEDNFVKEVRPGISGDKRTAPRVNNCGGISQKTEECSFSGDNVLGAHSSGPPSDNQAGPSGVSNSCGVECIVGNEEEFAESGSSSSSTELNVYSCDICGERFSQLEDIEAHMSGHVSEKSFRCLQCNERFHLADSLRKHRCNIRVKSAEKPICSWCGKGFSRVYHLRVHERLHTGERPFECAVCAKTFSQKNYLKLHAKTHSGERQFKCTECTKTFSFSGSLRRHEKTHSFGSTFQCTECGKDFNQKRYLKKHMLTHFGETTFKCPECSKAFHRKDNLHTHMKTHSC